MALIEEITNSILLAKSYQAELTEDLLEEQKSGCMDCKDQGQINRIESLVVSLESRILRNTLDDDTVKIYNCLLTAIANYGDPSLTIDPNASVPNLVIDVTIITDGRPDWIDIPWSQMTNDVSGYRDTYFNAEWMGLNPMIQIEGVVMYQVDVDYTNDGQGTIVFNEGKGLYNGQFFRAGNYQEYTPPTPSYPPAGTYRLVNESTTDTSYFISSTIPLVIGQTVNNDFTLGQTLLGIIEVGQRLNFKRYLSDGTIDLALVFDNPPATQYSTGVMDLTKSYEFIYKESVE